MKIIFPLVEVCKINGYSYRILVRAFRTETGNVFTQKMGNLWNYLLQKAVEDKEEINSYWE